MLIIWDFDGVICDSDYIWANNWQKLLLQEKNIKLSEDEVNSLLNCTAYASVRSTIRKLRNNNRIYRHCGNIAAYNLNINFSNLFHNLKIKNLTLKLKNIL